MKRHQYKYIHYVQLCSVLNYLFQNCMRPLLDKNESNYFQIWKNITADISTTTKNAKAVLLERTASIKMDILLILNLFQVIPITIKQSIKRSA